MSDQEQLCKKRIASPKRKNGDVQFCWTCGHYSQTDGNMCLCCGEQITKKLRKQHRRFIEVKEGLDEIIETKAEAEYKFRINGFVIWIKQSDLDSFKALTKSSTPEKYYHFLKSLSDNDRLSALSTWFVNPK